MIVFWLVLMGIIIVIKFPESKQEESKVKINRRIFLGSMLYVISASVLPSEIKKALNLTVFKSDAVFFDAEQFTLAYDIADIMIPRSDTPGTADSHTASVLDELMVSWAAPSTSDGPPFTIIKVYFQTKFRSLFKGISE